MASVTRETFLRPLERRTESVPVPEFGEGAEILVCGMNARERSEFDKQFQTKNGKPSEARQKEIRERLVAACCRNDDGTRMFTDDDVAAIGYQDATVVERIVEVAMRLCGMKADDVEALAKN